MSRVIVTVRGGVAEIGVLSGSDVEVLVLDYDIDSWDEDVVSEIDGESAAVTLHRPDGFPPRMDQTLAFETRWQKGITAIQDRQEPE